MNLEELKSKLNASSNVLIVLPMSIDADSIVSAALLFKLLSEKNKKISVASSRSLIEKYKHILDLVGCSNDSLISEIKPVSYVVSISDVKEKLDVRWNKHEDKLDVILTPEGGEIDFDKISYSKEGGIYDLVVTVNVSRLEDIGPIYSKHSKLFNNYDIISIGSCLQVNNNQVLSFLDDNYSTTSELIYKSYNDLGGQLDSSIAEITAFGIVGNTNGLQRVKNGITYDVISEISNKYQVDVPSIVRKYFYSMTKDDILLKEKILKNIKFDESRKAVYSTLTKADLGDINLSNFDFSTILPFNVTENYEYSFIAYENGLTSTIIISALKPDTQLEEIIRRAKAYLGKFYSIVQINSSAHDAAIRMLNVISGGYLDDKVTLQIKNKQNLEYKAEQAQQTYQVENDPYRYSHYPVENQKIDVMSSSPFTKAENYVVDKTAEPLKKADYFTYENKPFDKAN